MTPKDTITARFTTETHHDIGVHIVYMTTRPTRHTWKTIELDRHTIGAINPNEREERTAVHNATLHHYTLRDGGRTAHEETAAHTTATPTPTARAIAQMHATARDETTTRGQTIIEQIRADRARRQAALSAAKTTRARRARGLLTDPTRSIFA